MLQLKTSVIWKACFVAVLMLFSACQRISTPSGSGIIISGELKGTGIMIRLSELDVKTEVPIDSALIGKDGKFRFEIKPDGSSFYLLKLPDNQKLILVADSGDNIRIEGDAGSMINTARIEGSPASAWLLDFEQFTSLNEAKSDSLAQIFMDSRSDSGFASTRLHIDSAYQEIISRQKLYMQKFIDQHPASLSSLIVLNSRFGPNFILTEENDASYFIKVDSGLMATYPGNKHALDHHRRVSAMIKKQKQQIAVDSLMMPGNPVPDVRLNNEAGMPVSLSSLKGKVVLVYFWAAMDGNSRKFIRKLIPIYKANRNKGFEIFGVALEPNRTLWLNALKLDQPGGIQVTDEGGTGSPAAALFGIETLPEAMLIDKHGKIAARRISLEELRKKLPAQLQLK